MPVFIEKAGGSIDLLSVLILLKQETDLLLVRRRLPYCKTECRQKFSRILIIQTTMREQILFIIRLFSSGNNLIPIISGNVIFDEDKISDSFSGREYELNNVSFFLLSLCDGNSSTEEIKNIMCKKYNAREEVICKDVDDFLKMLHKDYMIEYGFQI